MYVKATDIVPWCVTSPWSVMVGDRNFCPCPEVKATTPAYDRTFGGVLQDEEDLAPLYGVDMVDAHKQQQHAKRRANWAAMEQE